MKQYTFYTADAFGTNSIWNAKLSKAGHKVKIYTVDDYDKLDSVWRGIISSQYEDVCYHLRKKSISDDSASGKIVRRDMMPADKATALFAVGEISNGAVTGSTAYAFQRCVLRGIPSYIYDQQLNRWFKYSGSTLVVCQQPSLVDGAAVLGTRHINSFGIDAINDIVKACVS